MALADFLALAGIAVPATTGALHKMGVNFPRWVYGGVVVVSVIMLGVAGCLTFGQQIEATVPAATTSSTSGSHNGQVGGTINNNGPTYNGPYTVTAPNSTPSSNPPPQKKIKKKTNASTTASAAPLSVTQPRGPAVVQAGEGSHITVSNVFSDTPLPIVNGGKNITANVSGIYFGPDAVAAGTGEKFHMKSSTIKDNGDGTSTALVNFDVTSKVVVNLDIEIASTTATAKILTDDPDGQIHYLPLRGDKSVIVITSAQGDYLLAVTAPSGDLSKIKWGYRFW